MEDWLDYEMGIDIDNITSGEWQQIYSIGGWENQGSGPGSKLEVNGTLISFLSNFIQQNNIASIIDLGCGDLQWIPQIFSENLSYVGVDYCQNIVDQNRLSFPDQDFILDNYINLSEPKELSFIKDVIHHDRDNMTQALSKLDELGSRYCMIVGPEYMKRHFGFNLLLESYNYSCVLDYEADEPKCLFLRTK